MTIRAKNPESTKVPYEKPPVDRSVLESASGGEGPATPSRGGRDDGFVKTEIPPRIATDCLSGGKHEIRAVHIIDVETEEAGGCRHCVKCGLFDTYIEETEMETVTCRQCGKAFEMDVDEAAIPEPRLCSKKCAEAWSN